MKTRDRWRQIGRTVLALAALAAVFCLYGHSDLAFDLSTRIWSCI